MIVVDYDNGEQARYRDLDEAIEGVNEQRGYEINADSAWEENRRGQTVREIDIVIQLVPMP